MTTLFREALNLCDQMGIQPYDVTSIGDGIVLVQPWDCHTPPAPLVGRVGVVSLVDEKHNAAHIHVAIGNVRVLVVVPANGITVGSVLKVPDRELAVAS